ncbi:MAG: asparagine synthase B [Mogibacterium sp.]|nr:asparagine synthase B [Mogibacterium sp.]
MCTIIGVQGRMLPREEVRSHFEATVSRGPDATRFAECGRCYLGFQRLAIMDLSDRGMQPFTFGGDSVVCNGEIYGFRRMKEELADQHEFKTESDCEVILPLYHRHGVDMFPMLGSEFALILYDHRTDSLIAARDPIGIRPLYYGYDRYGEIVFASEPKDLVGLCEEIRPFPPGHYYKDGAFHPYLDIAARVEAAGRPSDVEEVCAGIRDRLIRSVEERLDADAPLGFLLSGGLDSSLVCAISAKLLGRKIRTFAIGMDLDPIDLRYARIAADYIGADHTEFYMTREEILEALPEVIQALGTWDITTIRASLGMYLCCKKIRETTDLKVLMTGEISDELFGYKYTDFAPDAESFQRESEKRIRELHEYDVLRADRCISCHSMEGRVPFGDTEFVQYVLGIDPEIKMNRYGMGKYLLRHAFEQDHILPDEILWRQKAAFSDAVGHSLVDDLKEYAESCYTDEEFETCRMRFEHGTPFTKESLLYREIFEQYYPGQGGMIMDYWMPNREWQGCDVADPSARVLSNYGDSGK